MTTCNMTGIVGVFHGKSNSNMGLNVDLTCEFVILH
jgi:hypothetical protein